MNIFQPAWGNYLLKGFVEVTTPTNISWYPQTLAWKIILLVFGVYVIKKCYNLWQNYKINAYRRKALTWIKMLPAFYDLEQQPIYRQLPALLRQTALLVYNRRQVCHLQAHEWDAWLDEHCEKTAFSTRCTNQLHILSFAPASQLSAQQIQCLIKEVSLWIKFHRRLHD